MRDLAPTRPGHVGAVLPVLGVTLLTAFVVVPPAFVTGGPGEGVTGPGELRQAFGAAFAQYWPSARAELPPDLAGLVEYWFRYHVVKAVIAALLLSVTAVLGRRLWLAFVRSQASAGRRVTLACAAVSVSLLGLFSAVLVMANVQGAVAPMASLLPMLSDTTADGPQAATLNQVRHHLASPGMAAQAPPALDAMTADFARYHLAMAVIAATVALLLAAGSVLAWTGLVRTRRADRRERRLLGAAGVASTLLTLGLVVIAVANIGTAVDPVPALRTVFDGGW